MAAAKNSAQKSTEISKVEFSNDELLNISNFQDAIDLIMAKGGDVALAHEVIGNGFALLDDKRKLVGTGLLILQWRFVAGNFGEYVNMLVITEKNDKFIVSDGSGMVEQMREFTSRTGRTAGMAVKNGFTVSDYEFCEDTRSSSCQEEGVGHKHVPASSYYLDLSA